MYIKKNTAVCQEEMDLEMGLGHPSVKVGGSGAGLLLPHVSGRRFIDT